MKKYCRNEKIIHGELDDNEIMVNMDKGKYYGLNLVAKRIWDMIVSPKGFDEIVEILMNEYDIDKQRCTAEVTSFLESALERGIIIEDESCQ